MKKNNVANRFALRKNLHPNFMEIAVWATFILCYVATWFLDAGSAQNQDAQSSIVAHLDKFAHAYAGTALFLASLYSIFKVEKVYANKILDAATRVYVTKVMYDDKSDIDDDPGYSLSNFKYILHDPKNVKQLRQYIFDSLRKSEQKIAAMALPISSDLTQTELFPIDPKVHDYKCALKKLCDIIDGHAKVHNEFIGGLKSLIIGLAYQSSEDNLTYIKKQNFDINSL